VSNWLFSAVAKDTDIVRPVTKLHTSFKRDDLPYGCISPDDIARGIAFLASDDAKMISGALVPIDNAWSTI
jgi:NAD(P)-dependent dehydrogenase (short-subunit alcohol dehydrogenase family)